ncbi:MAG: hypothetical protein LAT84_09465 [Balneolia bacterium]|nr:hypothetical protein [Balneolia bacterium]
MQSRLPKTVLVIAYYFPPMGSSGVQRPLKFVKYLQRFGWKPVVLAPEPGLYTHYDDSLLEELEAIEPKVEVHRVKGNTPFDKAAGRKAVGNIPDWLAAPARFASSFVFLPDNKKGWIRPAVEKAMELHKHYQFDTVFATAPPYSNLMIAAELKTKLKLPVLMDFRDDWFGSHLISYPTPLHKARMMKMEQQCLLHANVITAINGFMLESLRSRNEREELRFEVLEQGFDPEDVSISNAEIHESKDDVTRILYNGLFYGENQPDTFLKGIRLLLDDQPDLEKKISLVFQGGLQAEHHVLIKKLGLSHLIEDRGYISHKQALRGLASADIVWFVVGHKKSAEQVTTGKLFEYIGSQKIILGLVPGNGEAARVLNTLSAGFIADPYDAVSVKNELSQILAKLPEFRKRAVIDEARETYSRIRLTQRLSELLTEMAATHNRQ